MANTFLITTPEANDVVAIHPSIDLTGAMEFHIGRLIQENGLAGYEPEVFAMICALTEDSPGPVRFLDIGANIGIFSIVAKAVFGDKISVSAIEPLPRLATFLRETAKKNSLGIEVLEYALTDRDGAGTFYVSSRSDTSNSLNRKFRPHKEEISVELRSLDSLYPAEQSCDYILKIDTETTEPDVLAGARNFIGQHKPAIICEVLAGRSEKQLAEYFGEMNYVSIKITGNPEWAQNATIAGDDSYTYRDWLFVPEQPSASVQRRFAAWYQAFSAAKH